MKEEINILIESSCPRCHGPLRFWGELKEEEKEVVRRLPASEGLSLGERQQLNRWCTRCWFEKSGDQELHA